MGCDIHLYVERQLPNGRWDCQDNIDKEGDDGDVELLAQFGDHSFDKILNSRPGRYMGRNYVLFAILANVRNDYGHPIPFMGESKGIPSDVSGEIRDAFDRWGGDAHSESWWTLNDLLAWEGWEKKIEDEHDEKRKSLKIYCKSFWEVVIPQLEAVHADPEKVRIVFWFDN